MEDSKSFSVVYDFCSNKTSSMESLEWLKNPPASCTLKGKQGLSMVPKPGSNFWCKAYRDPPKVKLSGHTLLYNAPLGLKTCIAETEFHLNTVHQFDQAGIMIYVDNSHWIKSGLEMEFVDEAAIVCAVTNKHSDSNHIDWPTREARMRVVITRYREALDCKVECYDGTAAGGSGRWESLRKGFIELPEGREETAVVRVGLYCAAPSKKETDMDGLEVFFKSFSIQGEMN